LIAADVSLYWFATLLWPSLRAARRSACRLLGGTGAVALVTRAGSWTGALARHLNGALEHGAFLDSEARHVDLTLDPCRRHQFGFCSQRTSPGTLSCMTTKKEWILASTSAPSLTRTVPFVSISPENRPLRPALSSTLREPFQRARKRGRLSAGRAPSGHQRRLLHWRTSLTIGRNGYKARHTLRCLDGVFGVDSLRPPQAVR
jgi:hypothetical protein